jgi:Rrf2 family nitric oxide-sensitive transcriptional repressor
MRLEITRRSDLAIRALTQLDAQGTTLKAADLAIAINSTNGFLPHVMSPLVKAGWVGSDPGRNGGYRLVVPVSTISILDVIEAVEGGLPADVCVLRQGACLANGPCSLHLAWSHARTALLDTLADTAVGDRPQED